MTSRLPISVDDGERPLLAPVNDLQNLRQNSADKMTGSYDNLVQHAAVCVHAGLHGRLHVGLRRDNILELPCFITLLSGGFFTCV